ncbi:HAMP domain-containing histidine kinase [Sphingobium sp. JS3065]|uniref:sensor histidine kinase n=1 Tax=Sphingobium sp. JS3065 TaxID=2970925 RepID=UPI0022646721|nr:HAMP domain-containing sensor histidine kinase [Sphingobium sp. JS3065]UZW57347.1 HAMP domain-containing histidine kinase [Sphingobium sp. JS3065]
MRVMRWRYSVIGRFALLIFLMQIACVLVSLWAVHRFTSQSVNHASREIAVGLRDDISATYAAAGLAAAGATVRSRIAADPGREAILLLMGPDGRRIAGNLDKWPYQVGTAESWRLVNLLHVPRQHGDPQVMGVVSTRFPDGTRLLTGHVVETDLRFGGYLEAALMSAVLLAVPLAAGAAWLAASIMQRRLHAVADTASAVETGQMERRITLSGSGDMFDALGEAINAMLDRITGLVEELRLVTDGLAHDLRSPLTRLRAVLDSALKRSNDEAAASALERAVEESDTLLRMLDTALLISRAEAGIGRESFMPVDTAALLQDFQDMYGALAEERNVTILVDAEPGVFLFSNREMLGQALSNLIDNALKYGGDRIKLSAHPEAGSILIQVADNGPGVPEEHRARALSRFARLDISRHIAGAGLGLSLAAAVARLHGGKLVLSDAAPGLLVTLSFPYSESDGEARQSKSPP